jgi:hypothetical protein
MNKNVNAISRKVSDESRKMYLAEKLNRDSFALLNEYYRFLLFLPNETTFEQYPGFIEWEQWTLIFPGWKYGILDYKNSAWRQEFEGIELPMNKFYKLN